MGCTVPTAELFSAKSKQTWKILYPVYQGPRWVRIMGKNRGRKSRDTLPLNNSPCPRPHTHCLGVSNVAMQLSVTFFKFHFWHSSDPEVLLVLNSKEKQKWKKCLKSDSSQCQKKQFIDLKKKNILTETRTNHCKFKFLDTKKAHFTHWKSLINHRRFIFVYEKFTVQRLKEGWAKPGCGYIKLRQRGK